MAGEWLSQLPEDLRSNQAFTGFATLGDFAKSSLEAQGKLSETNGKLTELEKTFNSYKESSIPKLPENATEEDRSMFYDALGRPKQASEYEFDGEDKNAPEWTNHWKQQFHSLGLTKEQAKNLSSAFNQSMQKLVEAHNARLQSEMQASETKLRNELGDKYDTTVELAKRMWTKYGEGEFDKAFDNGNAAYRATTIRMLMKLAALTGEDRSPKSGTSVKPPSDGNPYPKSNMPPARIPSGVFPG